jgi:hypothetical protein
VNSAGGTTYLTLGGGGAALDREGFFDRKVSISTPETVTNHRRRTVPGPGFSAMTATSYCYAAARVTPGTANASPKLELAIRDQSGTKLDAVTLVRKETMKPRRGFDGTSETGLYAGIGVGAAVLTTAGAGGFLAHRRRSG